MQDGETLDIEVDEALLEDSYEVLRCIEEALAANDP